MPKSEAYVRSADIVAADRRHDDGDEDGLQGSSGSAAVGGSTSGPVIFIGTDSGTPGGDGSGGAPGGSGVRARAGGGGSLAQSVINNRRRQDARRKARRAGRAAL